MRQDARQDIRGYSAKNFDFVCHNEKKKEVFLIDLKGSSGIVEDTKVREDDLNTLRKLQAIYGSNVRGLFVFFWLKRNKLNGDRFEQTFRIKALSVDEYGKKMKPTNWRGKTFFRCSKNDLKDIRFYLPELCTP